MKAPTRLVLLGHPVAHSLSPRMQNAALEAAAIPARYSAMDVEPLDLPRAIEVLRSSGGAGNVTIPHKEAVFALCGRVMPIARTVGAVNTFWFEGGVLVGTNTDVEGFDTSVRDLLALHHRSLPQRVTILGAGGSAAAVATAASSWSGVKVTIWSRSPGRAQALSQQFEHARADPDLANAVGNADLVVNATPIGLRDDDLPVALDLIPGNAALFDLAYRAGETAWVRAAHGAGLPARDGLGMLVEQGALAFRCWFGIEPDRRLMCQAASA